MATVTVPPDVSPWDAPLTPSYPPALSPGTKRATGRAETGGDSYADAPCPAIAGMWMLKRSEHLKRWNKRWVSLDAAGARLTFRASPGVAKALSHVAVEHIRGAFVSSVNFHGNKSYAGRCVCLERKHADPESDASREVFLVAATRADANKWVAKVRALVAERNPIDTDDAIRLSPVAAPPTPALVNERDPRRAQQRAVRRRRRRRPASAASSSFSSDAVTRFEKPRVVERFPFGVRGDVGHGGERRGRVFRACRVRRVALEDDAARGRRGRRVAFLRAVVRFHKEWYEDDFSVETPSRAELGGEFQTRRRGAAGDRLGDARADGAGAGDGARGEGGQGRRAARHAGVRRRRARRGGGGAAPRRRHADAARGESRRGGIPAPRAGGRQGGGRARGGAGTRAPRARGRARAYTKRARWPPRRRAATRLPRRATPRRRRGRRRRMRFAPTCTPPASPRCARRRRLRRRWTRRGDGSRRSSARSSSWRGSGAGRASSRARARKKKARKTQRRARLFFFRREFREPKRRASARGCAVVVGGFRRARGASPRVVVVGSARIPRGWRGERAKRRRFCRRGDGGVGGGGRVHAGGGGDAAAATVRVRPRRAADARGHPPDPGLAGRARMQADVDTVSVAGRIT